IMHPSQETIHDYNDKPNLNLGPSSTAFFYGVEESFQGGSRPTKMKRHCLCNPVLCTYMVACVEKEL
ncbi:unnamed protein product, partial [Nesidiocoris tenuis]